MPSVVIVARRRAPLLGFVLLLYLGLDFFDHVVLFFEFCDPVFILLFLILVLDGRYFPCAALQLFFLFLEDPELLCVHLGLLGVPPGVVGILCYFEYCLVQENRFLVVVKLEFNVFTLFLDKFLKVLADDFLRLLADWIRHISQYSVPLALFSLLF